MNLKNRFYDETEGDFFLNVVDLADINHYFNHYKPLAELGLITKATIPGEGNMNCVLRLESSNGRSVIIKQARPWVEKFPHIEAPAERVSVEDSFYSVIARVESLRTMIPNILHYDSKNHIIVLEDLGTCEDMTCYYRPEKSFTDEDIYSLIDFLITKAKIETTNFNHNTELRLLNHAHIFDLPFQLDNGFNLDDIQSGLGALAREIVLNNTITSRAAKLGEVYLNPNESRSVLLHGDYYPGSFMKCRERIYIIDPEFAFCGPQEWDLAILMAHLILAGRTERNVKEYIDYYQHLQPIDQDLLYGWIGTEIIRRLIGIAQLPLEYSIDEKNNLLKLASQLLISTN